MRVQQNATSAQQLETMWQRQQVVWHVMFAVLLAVSGVLIVVQQSPTRWWQLGGVLALGCAYLIWGPRGLCHERSRASFTYVAVAWTIFLALVLMDVDSQPWVLTFALFPQTWAMIGGRPAVAFTVVGVLGFSGIRILQLRATPGEIGAILVASLIMITLSLALGLFIERMVREAASRAEALDELRRAQEGLSAAERAAGVYAERERLSREIHDTLAQGFTSVVTLARAIDAALDRDDLQAARDRLALLEQTAAENLAEARLMVSELTPGHLQSATLGEALERVVARMVSESGLTGGFRVSGTPVAAPANAEVVLLRTAQEALSNIRKHSGASSFEVELSYADPARVHLRVSDDGSGFVDGGIPSGYGLAGARARAADLGADLAIDSAPGSGTTLRVSVPRVRGDGS